ncbi:hypothetical protein [Streptomyces sp. A1547]|uniref:Uncharacterized protein n=1 Tax=Streptomyces sp. R33 TaxID=3238629 RepID=A0AB39Y2X6_9ACTN|nr:hypothetical protein [Streptomyces sp. A1547]THA35967.1 hypothetical protein E6W17_25900 [Streptomyces sp. A1547]
MTDHLIPPQSGRDVPADPRNGRPPVHPSVSEAGRLLCAGTYLDPSYRARVIDELYVHEERIAAPSYGFDATRVLAHALRARRVELAWAGGILGAWFVGALLTRVLGLLFTPFLLLSFANWLRGRRHPLVRFSGTLLRIFTWLMLVLLVSFFWTAVSDDSADGEFARLLLGVGSGSPGGSGGRGGYDYDGGFSGSGGFDGSGRAAGGSDDSVPFTLWLAPFVYAAIVFLVMLQRGYGARIVSTDLAPRRYADPSADPRTQNPRFARVRDRIKREQHAHMVMYDINGPFTGAGEPYRPWQLSVELRPRDDLGPDRKPQPVTNADIVRRIVPLLLALRVPSPHGSAQAQAAVLDRLRELVVDECVFLPARGLPHRDQAPVSAQQFADHRLEAIEEGGERRRHFLRVRVGGWDEDLVVTVFVRVHTQGGMLMLEVAPHVLLPVRTTFQNAEADAVRFLNNSWYGKAAAALVATPGSLGGSFATLGRGIAGWWRIVTGGHGGARPEGPRLSVREIAAQGDGSLFHLMDLDRYLKTIQDRVVGGVTVALHEAGWHTAEFAQRAIHVADGGTFIQSVSNSAFSVGGTDNKNTAGSGTGSKGSSGGK